jgi:hypothetical protein
VLVGRDGWVQLAPPIFCRELAGIGGKQLKKEKRVKKSIIF